MIWTTCLLVPVHLIRILKNGVFRLFQLNQNPFQMVVHLQKRMNELSIIPNGELDHSIKVNFIIKRNILFTVNLI